MSHYLTAWTDEQTPDVLAAANDDEMSTALKAGDIINGRFICNSETMIWAKILKRTPKQITFQEIKVSVDLSDCGNYRVVTPTDTLEGEPVRRKIQNYGEESVNYMSVQLTLWNGKPARI